MSLVAIHITASFESYCVLHVVFAAQGSLVTVSFLSTLVTRPVSSACSLGQLRAGTSSSSDCVVVGCLHPCNSAQLNSQLQGVNSTPRHRLSVCLLACLSVGAQSRCTRWPRHEPRPGRSEVTCRGADPCSGAVCSELPCGAVLCSLPEDVFARVART